MTPTAAELLARTTAELAPRPADNPLVGQIEQGGAARTAVTALALEQRHVIASDRLSFRYLAERSASLGAGACAAFFRMLADGEDLAAGHLDALTAACGCDAAAIEAYEPLPGCQAYPSYVARLALTGDPAEVVLALSANFSAWGGYCGRIAHGLRTHYAFDDAACAFFDFFAAPAPDLDAQAEAAVQQGLDKDLDVTSARRAGRLLQSYEKAFWETLAELA